MGADFTSFFLVALCGFTLILHLGLGFNIFVGLLLYDGLAGLRWRLGGGVAWRMLATVYLYRFSYSRGFPRLQILN